MVGQGWLTLTAWPGKTFSTAPVPPGVQYGRAPLTPSSSPAALERAQTRVSSDCLPGSPGLGRVSTTSSGPRLEAPVAVGS